MPSAVAAQVEELRRQSARDREDIAAAKATVAQWNARLETEGVGATLMMRLEFKKLREKVDSLAATLADALDHRKVKDPPAPLWHDLDQAAEAAQLSPNYTNGSTVFSASSIPSTSFPAAGPPTA